MFCPNCGNNCGNAKFCSECGWDLRGVRIKNCAPEVENKRDISYYYNMYAPNKEAAIVALRADTGMSAFEALQAINILFGEDQCADACESAQTQFPSTSKKNTSVVKGQNWRHPLKSTAPNAFPQVFQPIGKVTVLEKDLLEEKCLAILDLLQEILEQKLLFALV